MEFAPNEYGRAFFKLIEGVYIGFGATGLMKQVLGEESYNKYIVGGATGLTEKGSVAEVEITLKEPEAPDAINGLVIRPIGTLLVLRCGVAPV